MPEDISWDTSLDGSRRNETRTVWYQGGHLTLGITCIEMEEGETPFINENYSWLRCKERDTTAFLTCLIESVSGSGSEAGEGSHEKAAEENLDNASREP